MPPTHLAPSARPIGDRYLAFEEREEIALELAREQAFERLLVSSIDRRVRSPARYAATLPHVVGASNTKRARRNGMPIVQLNGQSPANLRSIRRSGIMYRIA